MERFLIKLNRFSGWILFVLLVLYVISGYGITKGVINPAFSQYLHNKLLIIPFFIFFIIHSAISGKYAFIRWRVFKNPQSANIYILVWGLLLLVLFLWLYFL